MQGLVEGYSGTIMCYGQTGAGKTFTCSGSFTDYKYRGLIPRYISLKKESLIKSINIFKLYMINK